MQNIREGNKVARQSKLEARQCPTCRRWFSTTNGRRLHCYRCEEGHGSRQPTNPLFLTNKNNGLRGAQSGSSMPLNILGGHRWPDAVPIESELLRKVIRAEVGST